MIFMIVETVKIDDLISPDYNPRHITPEALESLKQSIDEFGYIDPLIVNRVNMHVVGGNQRLECLKALDYKEVEVIFINEPDINREKAINIRLNNSSGDWDIGKLDTIFNDLEIEGFDLTLTGFATENLQPFETSDEDTGIPVSETITSDLNTGLKPETKQSNADEPITTHKEDEYAGGLTDDDVTVKIGDVYVLGNHRLMCGDSSDRQNIDILIDKDKIDLILTDPPYGINIVNTNGKIGGGNQSQSRHRRSQCTGQLQRRERALTGTVGSPGVVQAKRYKPILNDDKPYDPTILLELNVDSIIWGANNFASKLPDSPKWLVWYKKPMDKANNDNFSDVELAWTNIKGKMCKMYPYLWSGLLREGNRKMELKERVHPTQKPVGLLINILNDYTDVNMNILDLYGGSGSTLIACEETQRNCYMMELDPYYCQVIINRWEHYTGQKAVKIN